MSEETNKALVMEFMERAFNQGDLSVIDEQVGVDGVDHQEPPGTEFRPHLRDVITRMRTAFPDLHFEIHDIIAEGDIVAFRSTMTGTHLGPFTLGNMPHLPATGRTITVRHMHFVRMIDGESTDLWHVWDIAALLRQLGGIPEQPRQTA